MGSTDDSFTRFPNDIFDELLRRRFSVLQVTVVLYVVRKVNGWGKPSDRISVTKLAKDTGYTRRAVVGAVGDLEKMGVLEVERTGSGRPSEMRISSPKNWDKPVNGGSHVNGGSQGTVVHRGVNGGSQGGVNVASQVPVNGGSHTKETIKDTLKETKQKKGADPGLLGPVSPQAGEPEAEDDDEGWMGESWGE